MIKIEIENHWANVSKHSTTKHGGTIKPVGIVYHYTCGWSTRGDIATLADNKTAPVSAHLVLSRSGEFTQLVAFNMKAWHAGPSRYQNMRNLNNEFIGIEISNIGPLKVRFDGFYVDYYGNVIKPDGTFHRSTRKTETPPKNWFRTSSYTRLPKGEHVWEPYTAEQLSALDEMTLALKQTYPSIVHAVSHEEIDTRGWKTDPGPAFPMDRYKWILRYGQLPPKTPPSELVEPKKSLLSRLNDKLRWPL